MLMLLLFFQVIEIDIYWAFLVSTLQPDPEDFWILTLVSGFMVVSAMVIFLTSGPYHSHSESLEIEMKVSTFREIDVYFYVW